MWIERQRQNMDEAKSSPDYERRKQRLMELRLDEGVIGMRRTFSGIECTDDDEVFYGYLMYPTSNHYHDHSQGRMISFLLSEIDTVYKVVGNYTDTIPSLELINVVVVDNADPDLLVNLGLITHTMNAGIRNGDILYLDPYTDTYSRRFPEGAPTLINHFTNYTVLSHPHIFKKKIMFKFGR